MGKGLNADGRVRGSGLAGVVAACGCLGCKGSGFNFSIIWGGDIRSFQGCFRSFGEGWVQGVVLFLAEPPLAEAGIIGAVL